MNNLESWLRLWHTPNVGPKTFNFLLSKYPSLDELFSSSYQDLIYNQVPARIADAVCTNKSSNFLRDIDWLESDSQHHILCLNQKSYPTLLRHIEQPPPILYVVGNPSALDAHLPIAVVGGRKAGQSARNIAFHFARQLTELGISIVSGLALGIDGAAHRGALECKSANTIAVLANGLDTIYPRAHTALAEQIRNFGALISEFSPGVKPLAQHFPRRNRIISGLCMATLVIEAAQKSGSLITANYALEQGREVFAIPGPINNPNNKGSHKLIQQGAKLTTCIEDILIELAPMLTQSSNNTSNKRSNIDQSLTVSQKRLLDMVEYTPTHIDVIIEKSGLTPEQVCSMLTELEISGHISADIVGQFSRI